jgi:Ca2+-binding RTX toxin-like protein
MAITITVSNNAGIDFAAYLADFEANFTRSGFGWFSGSASDFSGNEYATTEQPNLIPDTSKRSVVFESGGGAIEYDFATHVVGGDLDAIRFGYGLSYNSSTDTFPLSQVDLRISGIGYVNQTNSVHTLIGGVMNNDLSDLRTLLAANEIKFVGGAGADVFTGYNKNDKIYGGAGKDTLSGAGGDDLIDGGTGADTMRGGTGNDTYIVDNAADKVIEAKNEGTDTVKSSVTYALTSNVEKLVLTGTANINGTGNGLANTITGNSGNNILDGKGGADTMTGGNGNDTYIVDNAGDKVVEKSGGGTDTVKSSITYALTNYVEKLVLTGTANINGTGNSLANTITGNSGNNILDGKGGADTMTGGKGNDTYIVDNAGDKVVEKSGEGTDTVKSSVSYTLSGYVENLTLTGSGNINGTGNGLNNILTGNAGNNTLNGGAGADTMKGGNGNDVYVVDNAGDKVIEAKNQGTDTVKASVGFSLAGQYIENLTLTGSSNINGTGNGLNNILTGNAGNNTLSGLGGNDTLNGGAGNDKLYGGLGNDVLTGGAGKDYFVFDTALNAKNNVDKITDFSVVDDTIWLDHDIFTALSTGKLSAANFVVGKAAADANDHIIYNSTTGALYYDADGNGSGAAVKFAELSIGLALTHNDFVII